jgi:glycosyltransferase involved in cell wall biosynthesis
MAKQKVALVITVKDEEQAIVKLLESVVSQKRQPDEVVVTDAGSTDETRKKIKDFIKKIANLTLIDVTGKNRSEGRNIAILKCESKIVAVTDAGCTLKEDWLDKITKPIRNNKAESVAGYYLPDARDKLQESMVPYVAVMPDQLKTDDFLPSSRSIAFTKEAWEMAGKYPEKVEYCEDLTFAKRLKQRTKMVLEPEAIVYWQMQPSIRKFYLQIKRYAMGDVEARYWPHLWKITSIYLRYIVFIVLFPLFWVYLGYSVAKNYKYINHPAAIIFLPILRVVTDAGIIAGSLKGML